MLAKQSPSTHRAAARQAANGPRGAAPLVPLRARAMGILQQFSGKRVLVVDDEAATAELLKYNLEIEGIRTVETAHDGEEALALHEAEPFDLILLNHLMPQMTGLQALEELRRRGDRVPVVMHSASPRERLEARFLGLGLAAFVQTPFPRSEYIETVRWILQALPARATAEAPPAAGSNKSRTTRKSSPKGGKKK